MKFLYAHICFTASTSSKLNYLCLTQTFQKWPFLRSRQNNHRIRTLRIVSNSSLLANNSLVCCWFYCTFLLFILHDCSWLFRAYNRMKTDLHYTIDSSSAVAVSILSFYSLFVYIYSDLNRHESFCSQILF